MIADIGLESGLNQFANPSQYQHWLGHINGLIIRQYAQKIFGYVADFGCGDRRYSFVLANECATEVVAIDKELKILSIDILHPFIHYIQADLHQIPLDTCSIDNAISFHTLEHVQYPAQVIREMARVLKYGGQLVISVPYMMAYFVEDHHHFFDLPSLRELFEMNGFSTQTLYHDRRVDDHGNRHNCITGVFVK